MKHRLGLTLSSRSLSFLAGVTALGASPLVVEAQLAEPYVAASATTASGAATDTTATDATATDATAPVDTAPTTSMSASPRASRGPELDPSVPPPPRATIASPSGRDERTRIEVGGAAGPGTWSVSDEGQGGGGLVMLSADLRVHHSVSRHVELGVLARLSLGWDGEVRPDHRGSTLLYQDLGFSTRFQLGGSNDAGFRLGVAIGLSLQEGSTTATAYDYTGTVGPQAPTSQVAFGPFGTVGADVRFAEHTSAGVAVTLRVPTADFNTNGNLDWLSFDASLRIAQDFDL